MVGTKPFVVFEDDFVFVFMAAKLGSCDVCTYFGLCNDDTILDDVSTSLK
jgi:hypothetical protein